MPPVLHGKIVHRFELPCPKTKPREKRTKATAVPTSASGDKEGKASIYNGERCLVDNSTKHQYHCGFIFIPESESQLQKEFLLSLPKRLLKLTSDAVRLERNVTIKRYTEIPFLESTVTPKCENSRISTSSMIEVYDLDFLPVEVPETATEAKNTDGHRRENSNNIWTLTQFWRKEKLDFHKMKNSRPKFSLLATIDAISPIITLDPSNPFALIEVYDKENTDITCVVVLHGKQAMLNHAAIHPSDTLVFRDVVYKPWAVRKVLCDGGKDEDSAAWTSDHELLGRVPSHVFVATRADSVSWDHVYCNSNPQISSIGVACHSSQNQSLSERDENRMPPMITPIHLVASIIGKILGVQTLSVSSGQSKATVVHYLDIILLNQGRVPINDCKYDDGISCGAPTSYPRCRLYLSHFPMSVALQCSLRKGGTIQAHNVQLICSQDKFNVDNKIVTSYGACLRSTLILLKHGTDVTISSVEEKTQAAKLGMEKDSISAFSTQPREHSDTSLKTKSSTLHSERFKLQRWGRMGSDTSSKQPGYSNKDLNGSPTNFVNYGFRRIKQSYAKDLYFEHVKDWEHRGFQSSARVSTQRDYSTKRVPRTWLVNALLDSNSNNFGNKNKKNTNYGRADNSASFVPQRTNRQGSIRSPYVEFFSHSFSFPVNDEGIFGQDPSSSCHISLEDGTNVPMRSASLVDLNWIRIASQNYFKNHISRHLHSTATSPDAKPLYQLRRGFHGSIRVPLPKLRSNLWKENNVPKKVGDNGGRDDENNGIYFMGGFVTEVHSLNSSVASIADGVCQIPVSFSKTSCHANIDDFFLGQFDSVIISCLCLGTLDVDSGRDHNDKNASISNVWSSESKSAALPALNPREKALLGNCSLVTINGYLFITAIQINCREYQLHKMTKSPSQAQEEVGIEEVVLTVENCLATNQWMSDLSQSNTVMGMLTRCQFYSKMNTDSSHKCCRLTISSLKRNEAEDIELDNSCLQALELSVSVAQSTARMAKCHEIFSRGWSKTNLSASQKAIASSFWALGGSGKTCALTFGGSDDLLPGSWCTKSSIKIAFPASSLQVNKLGYIRSLCTHDCLDAFFESCRNFSEDSQLSDAFANNASSEPFDFVGISTATAGMLNSRLARRTIFRSDIPPLRTIGELSTICSNAIPLITLSDIFELVFRDLEAPNTCERILSPSLVRRISNARFLGVSFCQVQCYCTRCFCSLADSPSTTGNRKRRRNESVDEPTFWHLPHPEESKVGIHRTTCLKSVATDNSTTALPEHIRSTKFRCPKNNCSKQMFGVRWECSGVVDDGTGQATMYADGDAALTLLGMSAKTIQTIEEGVWSMPDGSIQFMKSIPPPKNLRGKVINILATQRSDDCKTLAMIDPLRLLSIQDRAAYLLERHCRSSTRPRRQLDYYVRCKPLVKKDNAAPHLHHTTIDAFFEECATDANESSTIYRGQVASYAIPSLKLELVDCGVNSHGNLCTNFK